MLLSVTADITLEVVKTERPRDGWRMIVASAYTMVHNLSGHALRVKVERYNMIPEIASPTAGITASTGTDGFIFNVEAELFMPQEQVLQDIEEAAFYLGKGTMAGYVEVQRLDGVGDPVRRLVQCGHTLIIGRNAFLQTSGKQSRQRSPADYQMDTPSGEKHH